MVVSRPEGPSVLTQGFLHPQGVSITDALEAVLVVFVLVSKILTQWPVSSDGKASACKAEGAWFDPHQYRFCDSLRTTIPRGTRQTLSHVMAIRTEFSYIQVKRPTDSLEKRVGKQTVNNVPRPVEGGVN